MPSTFQQHLARIRDESRHREELYRGRYSSSQSTAPALAKRWRVALESEPLDWAELSAIREAAQGQKAEADVALFGFINQLEADYSALRTAELDER